MLARDFMKRANRPKNHAGIDRVLKIIYDGIYILPYNDMPPINIIPINTISYWCGNSRSGFVSKHAATWLLSVHAMRYSELDAIECAYRYGHVRLRLSGMEWLQIRQKLNQTRPLRRLKKWNWAPSPEPVESIITTIYRSMK